MNDDKDVISYFIDENNSKLELRTWNTNSKKAVKEYKRYCSRIEQSSE